jgi:hypothetical protein
MQFLTYNGNGPFTGAYIQDEAPVGISFLEVGDADYRNWCNISYQDGVIVPTPGPDAAQLLATAQATQTATISAACQAAIYAGFTSSALGAVYTYPFGDKDQTNLNGDVSLSMLPANQVTGWTTPFWCADSNGVWDMRSHSAAQIQQVGSDAAAAKLACVNKNIALATQVAAATTVVAVQSIVWS